MKNNISSPNSFDDDISDSLSTTNSFSHFSTEAGSFFQPLSEINDNDTISPQNKKIRKKRTAYGKIDDDKRLQLLEAVQQRGETLKSASKRLGINYSSAKSIIHTYRKEGRILKKSVVSFPYAPMELKPFENVFGTENFQLKLNNSFSGTLFPFENHQTPSTLSSQINTGPSSPLHGLTNALGHLGLGSQHKVEEPVYVSPQVSNVQIPSLEFNLAPRLPLKEIIVPQQQQQQVQYHQPASVNPKIPIINSGMEQTSPAHPRELFKNLDNFYMNYSNSPLSGGKGNMYNDDSSSRRANPREYDSFSELISSFQNPGRTEDQVGKPVRFNSMQETKINKEDNYLYANGMESAARENYKNLVEAQWLLTDSLKKTTYLNNMARFQNGGISPINGWNK